MDKIAGQAAAIPPPVIVMNFLATQHRHSLIPQSPLTDARQEYFQDSANFKRSLFQLFQQKLSAFTAQSSEPLPYKQLRQKLDQDLDIQAAHQRRQTLQDQLWQITLDDTEADSAHLTQAFEQQQQGKGQLELNLDCVIPNHQTERDIHRMPGGYLSQAEPPYLTGALYDHGVFLYGQGWLGPLNDQLAQIIVQQVLQTHYPQLNPTKILDMGCSVGHSTLPYTDVFPDAQVWGIDVSPSLLQYAIARSRSLDKAVTFAQQNAEQTDFADNSFDLIVSHILFHEIPGSARKQIFVESYRLLKPAGVMVHLDGKLFLDSGNPLARYFRDTEVWANSEPFLGSSAFADFVPYGQAAGFAADHFHCRYLPENGDTSQARWIAFCGEKPA